MKKSKGRKRIAYPQEPVHPVVITTVGKKSYPATRNGQRVQVTPAAPYRDRLTYAEVEMRCTNIAAAEDTWMSFANGGVVLVTLLPLNPSYGAECRVLFPTEAAAIGKRYRVQVTEITS